MERWIDTAAVVVNYGYPMLMASNPLDILASYLGTRLYIDNKHSRFALLTSATSQLIHSRCFAPQVTLNMER